MIAKSLLQNIPFDYLKFKQNKNHALDIACGKGEVAIKLSKLGWNITAVDIDKNNAKFLQKFDNIQFYEFDLESNIDNYLKKKPFNKKFDLVIIFRYLHRPLLGRLASLLYDNGILIYKTFAEGNEKYGHPKSKKYLLKTKELLKLETPELKILKFNEGLTKINGNKKKMQTAIFKKIKN